MITAAELLDLERVGDLRFVNRRSLDNFQGAIFGGQALGQALAAAQRTVPSWPAHTSTGYFLRAGKVAGPIEYRVERVRDGRRFAARRVLAEQAGQPIFDLICSFHDAEQGVAHQSGNVADVAQPEELVSVSEYVARHANRLPRHLVARHEAGFPIELRLTDPDTVFFGKPAHVSRDYWMRMESGGSVDSPQAHRCLLAFMSDYWLAAAAGAPHRTPTTITDFPQIASLNHSLWFHAPVRADEWLLYRTESPWAGEGRGLARGLIYNRNGVLVASAVQEISLRFVSGVAP